MEFTKTSNVGPLIAAVLVGLLSLCVTYVCRMTPEDIDKALSALELTVSRLVPAQAPLAAEPVDPEAPPDPAVQRSPEELLELSKLAFEKMQALNERVRGGAAYDASTVATLVRAVNTAQDGLTELESISAEQRERVALDRFKTLFVAAEFEPALYSTSLLEAGETLLKEGSAERHSVQLFMAYHKFGVSRIRSPSVLRSELETFANAHDDPALEIDFFLLVARELIERRDWQMAKLALEEGLKIYSEHESRSKLANLLIDLKMRNRIRHH